MGLWCLGYPNSARIDLEHSIRHAREIGQAGDVDVCTRSASAINLFVGDYVAEIDFLDELADVDGTKRCDALAEQ